MRNGNTSRKMERGKDLFLSRLSSLSLAGTLPLFFPSCLLARLSCLLVAHPLLMFVLCWFVLVVNLFENGAENKGGNEGENEGGKWRKTKGNQEESLLNFKLE